jgi:hypothetical protein
VCALAHAFEARGLATVVLSSVRAQAEDSRAPRVLHCEFPLGRPLGVPGDPEFQHRVLAAAFELLSEPAGPLFVEFGEEIVDHADQPLSCPIPPFHDPNAHPAVSEARGLRAAYDRTVARVDRTAVHRVLSADDIPDAVAGLVQIAEGSSVEDAHLPGALGDVMLDVRAYYEEAGLALADHTPAARQLETWLYQHTRTGTVMLDVRQQLQDSGAPQPEWMYLAPVTQQPTP